MRESIIVLKKKMQSYKSLVYDALYDCIKFYTVDELYQS